MNALRLKITLLVMGAIVAMSVIGIAAAFSVSSMTGTSGGRIAFRYSPDGSAAPPLVLPPVPEAPSSLLFALPVEAVMIGYAALIVAGSAMVGLVVANMVVRPLAVLEEAVNSVDPEGFIPHLDETGLGEDLAAAKLINRLSERLKTAMESRMRLVAAAGHDLRTPLTRMRLRVEFMEDPEEREKWNRDIDEMMHIADSAIRLVKEEAGTQSYERIDLDTLVCELCEELREIGHDITVDRIEPVRVRGGFHSLKRAVSNLLVNACTHGGSATIRLLDDDGQAVIEIEDEGPGIPEDMLSRAFEPFFRANPARTRSAPGAGLGLAISKEILTRHGGSVTLANRPEGGLQQTVTLPVRT